MLFSVNTTANGYIGPKTPRRAGSLLTTAVHGVTASDSIHSNGDRSGGPPGADPTPSRSPVAPRNSGNPAPGADPSKAPPGVDPGAAVDGEEILAWETRLKERNLRPRPAEETPPDSEEAATASRRVLELLREAGPSALVAQSNQTARAVLYLLE